MARMLCIGGDPYLTDLLRYALTREGFEVRVAHTGRDGLRMIRVDGFALVILDDILPDMDGRAVLSSLRTFSAVPVVMATAGAGDGGSTARLGQGAVDYVAKPFSVQALIDRVKVVLRRETENLGVDDTVN